MSEKFIIIQGAREHNLANLNIAIPREKLVVLTGLSGSGKSSLAFDTIYAEGQRKYVESLSAYARQFLEQMQKPDVDHIEGLPPTIAIEQRSGSANPRSTVATTTEIYDYLRLLFARAGDPFCHKCGQPIRQQTPGQIVDAILTMPEGTKIQVCSPMIRGQKGQHQQVLARLAREGFVRVRIDGTICDVKAAPELDKNKAHTIEAVIDRLVIKPEIRSRLADSIELGCSLSEGLVLILSQANGATDWSEQIFSQRWACVECGVSLEDLAPRMFSFNSPYGACPACDGLGTILEFDAELIVPDEDRTLHDGAIDAWRKGGKRMNIFYNRLLRQFCRNASISIDTPFKDIPAKIRKLLIYGTTPKDEKQFGFFFEGVLPNLDRRFRKTESEFVKARLAAYLSEQPCETCHGARLRPESLSVRINGMNIHEVTRLSIERGLAFFRSLAFNAERTEIARQILKEIVQRMQFMVDVGVGYLSMDRTSATLSGGEAQRIRLATQVGSGLVGVCYVLDEPTIGLHHRDNARLINTLKRLVTMGNSVLVVEHDEDTIRAADWIVDVGPGAGRHGGQIVAQGTLEQVLADERSITAKYLTGRCRIETPTERRRLNEKDSVDVIGASENNLKGVDVSFPLGGLVCVTGVSGSGKSTLVNQTLLRALKRRLYGSRGRPGAYERLSGVSKIDKVIEIDQSPIGRTPRSNPATYTGVFDLIRQLYAKTREAKIRGYKAGRFSFNVKGGRCESCQGQGTKKIEMHFLPDIYVTCAECKGTRYNRETLEIHYRGKNIADVLAMRVEESLAFFENFPKIRQLLQTLNDVGLGYIELGQSSTTLSGGEAQRVKLAGELGKAATGHTFYVLDEPTTGLHFADIHNLLNVLNRLVSMGNTVVVIEHNMDVIKCADWIIDMGPEGGDAGGTVVATGTPEQIAAHPTSYTGLFLRDRLTGAAASEPPAELAVAPPPNEPSAKQAG
ncbi:MAG: excinuclease ABC subunit UvrA [Phycisphaerae bacterium]|nr:excinuclease ABC subunit UvrA [Phycisphaerae bacterium]